MILETIFLLFGVGAWKPGLESVSSETIHLSPLPNEWHEQISISAKEALVMDLDSMGVLYQKNKDMPVPMASLTKMMTALLILENHELTETLTTPTLSEYVEGSSMRLKSGDVMTVGDLLSGLMINSGNDAATVLAAYNAGTVFAFVKKMNDRASELGLHETSFQNPHGLDAPNHYASARDLAIIAKSILQYPALRSIVSTSKTEVHSELGSDYELVNTNELLDSPFPVYGIKTGTTDNAGECLALLVKSEGKEYLIIILGSSDRYLDAKTLIWHVMGKPDSKKASSLRQS